MCGGSLCMRWMLLMKSPSWKQTLEFAVSRPKCNGDLMAWELWSHLSLTSVDQCWINKVFCCRIRNVFSLLWFRVFDRTQRGKTESRAHKDPGLFHCSDSHNVRRRFNVPCYEIVSHWPDVVCSQSWAILFNRVRSSSQTQRLGIFPQMCLYPLRLVFISLFNEVSCTCVTQMRVLGHALLSQIPGIYCIHNTFC